MPNEPLKIRVCVDVTVIDPKKLVAYAKKRYRDCWGKELPKQEDDYYDLRQAVFEAMIGSNENPNPTEYGVEILQWDYAKLQDVSG